MVSFNRASRYKNKLTFIYYRVWLDLLEWFFWSLSMSRLAYCRCRYWCDIGLQKEQLVLRDARECYDWHKYLCMYYNCDNRHQCCDIKRDYHEKLHSNLLLVGSDVVWTDMIVLVSECCCTDILGCSVTIKQCCEGTYGDILKYKMSRHWLGTLKWWVVTLRCSRGTFRGMLKCVTLGR